MTDTRPITPADPPADPPASPDRERRRPWWKRSGAFRAIVALVAVAAVAVALLVLSTREGEPAGEGAPPVSGAPRPSATPPPSAPPAPLPVGVDVRTFGATGDGVTDDAPAIRRALAEADAVHVPAGTYVLASYASPRTTVIPADFVFTLRTGQTITADPGAVFVMADGVVTGSPAAWGGNVFLADAVDGVTISGLTLDLNGPGNLVPAGRTITGYGLYTWAAHDVTLQDVTMQDTPGQNYVVVQNGGSGIRVLDSTFHNGGTSIPGNEEQTDFSALYFTATDVLVDGVTIDHDEQPFDFSGGVELHGSREAVTDSEISDSWPAVYIGPDTYSELAVQEDVSVTGNRFLDCGRGVVFNALGTGDIDGVDISGNEFRLASFDVFGGEPVRAVDQDMPPDGNWTYHHIITGMTIGGNTFHGGGATSDGVIRLSQVHSATISGNRFEDVAGTVFALSSSPWDTTGVTFADNDIAWTSPEDSPAIALSFDGSSTIPEREAFNASRVSVTGNRLVLAEPESRSCAVHATWPDAADVSEVTVAANDFRAVDEGTCGAQAAELGDGD